MGGVRRVNEKVYIELELPDGRRLGLYQRAGFGRNIGQEPWRVPPGGIASTELYFLVSDLGAPHIDSRRPEPAFSPPPPRVPGAEVAYYADPDGNVIAVARMPEDV